MTASAPLPTIARPAALATAATDTRLGLVADLGEQVSWHYVDFFTANTRNKHKTGLCARLHSST